MCASGKPIGRYRASATVRRNGWLGQTVYDQNGSRTIVGKLFAAIKNPSAIGSLLILPVLGQKVKCVSWPKPTHHLMSLPNCIAIAEVLIGVHSRWQACWASCENTGLIPILRMAS